jgi:Predicted signal transduction protein with a C-terminal ATPase domain
LVENAVQHGLSGRKKGGTVEITVRDKNDFVLIVVEDDGVGIEGDILTNLLMDHKDGNGGVALINIHRRLLQMYGRGLEIERRDLGGTRVSMRIKK